MSTLISGSSKGELKKGRKSAQVKKENSPKKKMKDNTKSSSEQSSGALSVCMEGMSSAEMTMVRRLAGNDPLVRKKTLRKLKKWLNILSQKVPDTPDCRSMVESNFIRVWKALFYCMWMSDKPLPQEQLAEQLSNLQIIFVTKTSPFLMFVEWFIRTIAREWNWIDRFRIDKFMMLFRRFLRKTLMVIAQKKWHNDVLEGFLKIISLYIFNRHPPVSNNKKRNSFSSPLNVTAPLGLQIHFTDVFMEELAKVGGETLKFQKTLKILSVFIQELGYNNDDRLLDEIRERIFNHLMRQSDVGIDYQEQLATGGFEVIEDEEEQEASEELDDESNELVKLGADKDEEIEEDDGPLDPRAGAVDVILPQLDVDYQKLYQKLVEYGGQKDVKLKNRRILYSLASQFREITEGKYPLALPEDDDMRPAIPRKEINKAAKRLLETEPAPGEGKRRKTKKERKRDAKRKLNATFDSVGSEDDSQFIHDDELLDHVTDNYMSYLENEVEAKADSNRIQDDQEAAINETEGETTPAKQPKGKVKKEKEKVRKRKWKTEVEVEADEVATASEPSTENVVNDAENSLEDNSEKVVLVKRPRLSRVKRSSLGSVRTPDANTPLKGKARLLSEMNTPISKSSPSKNSLTKSASRRVSFVLARNKEHEHADYPASIARSPAIPFDKDRRPNSGLLKSPGSVTPKSTPVRHRATALDFF